MTLLLEFDNRMRGTRKRLFNPLTRPKSYLPNSFRSSLPVINAARASKVASWQNVVRTLFFIILPVIYFFATVVTFTTQGTNPHNALSIWPSSEYIPLLQSPGSPHAHGSGSVQSIGIVAACRNRHSLLKMALPTWLGMSAVREVVIVDWESTPPLTDVLTGSLDDHRVRIVRVEGEPTWVLSRAYNLGMSVASAEWIIRLDCDCQLRPGFLSAHFRTVGNGSRGYMAAEKTFWSGRWQNARDGNEVHLNGAVLVRRGDFRLAHGYDERIQTYGWDDEDLFGRLQKLGLRRQALDYNFLRHVWHGDAVRAREGGTVPEVSIEFNALLLKHLPPWRGPLTWVAFGEGDSVGHDGLEMSRYEMVGSRKARHLSLRTLTRPPAASSLVREDEKAAAWGLALGRRLHDKYGLCWDLMTRMDRGQRERLLNEAVRREEMGRAVEFLVVHVMHGLGNRLRALGSGLAFAKATGRVAFVVWEKDQHCGVGFEELFEREFSDGGEVVAVDGIGVSWPFGGAGQYDGAWERWKSFNYMEREGGGAKKDERIGRNLKDHVYFKGAYVMQTLPAGIGGWDAANIELRRLVPVKVVSEVVEEVGERLRRSVGVHIRHLDTTKDIGGVDAEREYGRDDKAVIDYWRQASSPEAFVDGVRKVKTQHGQDDVEVFVVGDNAESVQAVIAGIGNRSWTLDDVKMNKFRCVEGEGRSVGCLRIALVDLMCLARTRLLLGSMWSSFSEAASRLGRIELRLAGVDFGAAASENMEQIEGQYGAAVATVVGRVRLRRAKRRRRFDRLA